LYRPVAVSLASATDPSRKSGRFPGHILLKVKANEDHVSWRILTLLTAI